MRELEECNYRLAHHILAITFVRSARDLSKTLSRPDDDLQGLERRAEALRAPIH
jgi:hypothetical protein